MSEGPTRKVVGTSFTEKSERFRIVKKTVFMFPVV